MASQADAQKIALAGGGFMAATVLVQAVKGERDEKGSVYRQLWQIGVLVVVLAVAADFLPQVIVPLTVAIVAGFYFTHPGVLGPLFGVKQSSSKKKGG